MTEASNFSQAFLAKARESLAGASIQPPGGKSWSHTFVQAAFGGVLIRRRKLYPATLRDALSRAQQVRDQADYERATVSQT